jgi:pimeloyl-ACP methyl ester carboxylesterase
MNRHILMLLALTSAAALLMSCGGGGAKTKPASAAPTAASAAARWQTPQILPVTPIAVAWKPSDATFDALPGARAIFGETDTTSYEIEVPDTWNGDVVYFAHGFRGNGPDLVVQAPPIRDYLIQNGYAWAASSYSANGYDPGAGARDTYALRDIFAQKVGAPKHAYLYGQSMGGNVASLSLETYPTAYDGAFSECGAVAGKEILDFFIDWAAVSGYLAGQDLFTQSNDAAKLATTLRGEIGRVLGPPQSPTDKGKAFANIMQNLTGGPRPFFREGYSVNYVLNFGLLVQAVAQPQIYNAVASNDTSKYHVDEGFGLTDAQIDAGVGRVKSNPAYLDPATYPQYADLTGKIQRPFLTIHGTGDLFVPISMEQSYRRKVEAAGAGDLLVQRAIRTAGHCAYSQDERIAGFEDLVKWVVQGQKPAGDDLLGDLTDIGRQFTIPVLPDDPGGVTP